jgi:hypothetical protein
MLFPISDGTQPKIWLDKGLNYFHIYQIPESLWVEAATMHLQDNASKWWQTHKQSNPAVNWKKFATNIQETFGPDDHRSALNDLLDLKQTSTVEEYTTQFKSLQYDVSSMAVSMMPCSLQLSMLGISGMISGLWLSLKCPQLWRELWSLPSYNKRL